MLRINGNYIVFVKHAYLSIEERDVCDVKGYFANISLEFLIGDKTGYLDLAAGWEEENKLDLFLKRIYAGVPFGNEKIGYLEFYDTKKVYTNKIKSKLYLALSGIEDNKVNAEILLEDKLLSLKYVGSLEYI